MANPRIRVRLKPEDLKRFMALKARFGYTDIHSGDRETVLKLIELSEKQLSLMARVKELFGGLL